MDKSVRVALFYTQYDKSKDYAKGLADQIGSEACLVDAFSPKPCYEVLPLRATPNVALLLFVDSLEEMQEQLDVLRQLGYIRKQEAVTEIVDELIEQAGELPPELEAKIADTFYGG